MFFFRNRARERHQHRRRGKGCDPHADNCACDEKAEYDMARFVSREPQNHHGDAFSEPALCDGGGEREYADEEQHGVVAKAELDHVDE
ncbi:hypothetical protein SDC9_195777 [bioreactor metagenome]|uniref:Uncharacterized protein n=1 Tax=bioreactor metagenome TaxID=1076179 RepID=A0A645IBG4_9ZZZZ